MKGDFNQLIQSDRPVLIDFFATWCGPCQMIPPILNEVKTTLKEDVRIIKIDIDKNKALADRFNVRSVPTLMIFRKGEVKWRLSGVPPHDMIVDAVRAAV